MNFILVQPDDLLEEDEKPKDEVATPEHLHRLYIFALTWSLGAFLDSADRIKMDKFMRKKFKNYDYPKDPEDKEATLFEFFVSQSGMWEPWKNLGLCKRRI